MRLIPLIRLIGGDEHELVFMVRSESRPLTHHHELTVCRATCQIRCTCEDAVCRKKVGNLLLIGEPCCKHMLWLKATQKKEK